MESQKIISLLDSNDNDNDSNDSLPQKDGTLLMIKTLVIMLMVMVRIVYN